MSWPWPDLWNAWPTIVPSAACGLLVGIVATALVVRAARRRGQRRDQPKLRSDVAELAGQLEDYARQIDQQVAQRLDRLEALLTKADEKEAELKRLVEAQNKPPEEAAPRPRATDEQLAALAAEGLDSVEIARRLRMEVGEVELMLNLHRSQAAPKP
jgi:chromosome segregation ATPase